MPPPWRGAPTSSGSHRRPQISLSTAGRQPPCVAAFLPSTTSRDRRRRPYQFLPPPFLEEKEGVGWEKRGSDGIEPEGRRKIIYRVEGSKKKRRRRNRDRDRIEGLAYDASLIGLGKGELFLFVSLDGVPIRSYRHRPAGVKIPNRVLSGQAKETEPRKGNVVSRGWSWQVKPVKID
ncbi:hypothetical protein BHE74_00013193 [Ensete ventricosum]|nr:hypothetical protein BHE74_00013193 [Ensete ventricosum]RZR91247.1 hypothetical protein BHM03_00019333 [Ensete ventricosum]